MLDKARKEEVHREYTVSEVPRWQKQHKLSIVWWNQNVILRFSQAVLDPCSYAGSRRHVQCLSKWWVGHQTQDTTRTGNNIRPTTTQSMSPLLISIYCEHFFSMVYKRDSPSGISFVFTFLSCYRDSGCKQPITITTINHILFYIYNCTCCNCSHHNLNPNLTIYIFYNS